MPITMRFILILFLLPIVSVLRAEKSDFFSNDSNKKKVKQSEANTTDKENLDKELELNKRERELDKRENDLKKRERSVEEREKKILENEKPNQASIEPENLFHRGIYFQGSKGISYNETDRGPITSYKIGYKERVYSYFTAGFGLNHGNLFLQSRVKDFSSNLTLALGTLLPSNDSLEYRVFMLTAAYDASYKDHYAYGALSGDLNFHPNQNKQFDPFIGISVLAGSCGNEFRCTLSGYELRAGLQFNLTDFFIFFQTSSQNLYLSNTYYGTVQINNTLPTFGFGTKF